MAFKLHSSNFSKPWKMDIVYFYMFTELTNLLTVKVTYLKILLSQLTICITGNNSKMIFLITLYALGNTCCSLPRSRSLGEAFSLLYFNFIYSPFFFLWFFSTIIVTKATHQVEKKELDLAHTLWAMVQVKEVQSRMRKSRLRWVGWDKQVNSWCFSVKNKAMSVCTRTLSKSFLN